jgi:ribulose-5-phosphate 4-epimerase/fuculose-1-phosphate aldolase
MQLHEDSRRADLRGLVEQSVRLGSDLRLVQGAGGNLSVKVDGVLWIKASGTRLADAAEREIFVPMDEGATRDAVLVTEDLTSCVRPHAPAGLRPSIETALHVLLPHRVVFHVHGVGSIAAGLTGSVHEAVAALPSRYRTVVVPYAKPGVELARAVLAATGRDLDPERPLVLVLRNHGVVVGAGDTDEAAQVLDDVESSFRCVGAPPVQQADAARAGRLCPPGTLDDTAADVLCAGALTPDSAVFLGPTPFGRIDVGPAPTGQSEHSAFVARDGSVWLNPAFGTDEREIAISLVDVARQVPEGQLSTLSPAQVDELVNWEAEKWRRQLKR